MRIRSLILLCMLSDDNDMRFMRLLHDFLLIFTSNTRAHAHTHTQTDTNTHVGK